MLVALTPELASARQTSGASTQVASEWVLCEAIARGDERLAADVYARLLPPVQATLRRVLGSPYRQHQALVCRSIEQIIAAVAQHPRPRACGLEAWATLIAARVAVDVLRSRKRERSGRLPRSGAPEACHASGEAPGEPSAAIDRLRSLLAELPPAQAELVVACDVMGVDVGDVALALQARTEQVRRLLSESHEQLARQLHAAA